MGWSIRQLAAHKYRDSLLRGSTRPQAVKKGPPQVAAKPETSPLTLLTPIGNLLFNVYKFSVNGLPVGKPRMTKRDQFRKRPCVLRYREYCDRCRAASGALPNNPDGVQVTAYIPVRESWSGKKRARTLGQPHRFRPDADNILKSVNDALFKQDCTIWICGPVYKIWCEPGQERTEVSVLYRQ